MFHPRGCRARKGQRDFVASGGFAASWLTGKSPFFANSVPMACRQQSGKYGVDGMVQCGTDIGIVGDRAYQGHTAGRAWIDATIDQLCCIY